MRPIKFRGKRVGNKEWVHGYLYRISEKLYPYIMTQNSLGASYEVIPETVGQYTGLQDKNGKEIHDGDFVTALKHNEFPHTNLISWRVGMFWFGNWNWYEFLNIFRSIEIIGNIYENPEIPSGGTPNE